MDMLEETLMDCRAFYGGLSIGERSQEGRMLLEFCDAKHL